MAGADVEHAQLPGQGISELLTQQFYDGSLDLAARVGAPMSGWQGMPEVRAVEAIRAEGADDRMVRLFVTLVVALDRARDSDRLWDSASAVYRAHPWLFEPRECVARPDDVRRHLKEGGVSQRHQPDANAWLRICKTLVDEESSCPIAAVVRDGEGDANVLDRRAVAKTDGVSLFPQLRGPKIRPLWIRVLAYPGGALIRNLDVLPVAVDVQVLRATRCLGVMNVDAPVNERKRRLVQEAWQRLVAAGGTVGPVGIEGTCAALDPALWFWGKWGCSQCEASGRKSPIGDACQWCVLDAGAGAPIARVEVEAAAGTSAQFVSPERRRQRGVRRARTSVEVISDAGAVEVGSVFILRPGAFTPREWGAIVPLVDGDPSIARASWTGRGRRQALAWEYDGAAYSPRGIIVKILEMAGLDKDPTGPDYWTVPGTDRSMYEESIRIEGEADRGGVTDGP